MPMRRDGQVTHGVERLADSGPRILTWRAESDECRGRVTAYGTHATLRRARTVCDSDGALTRRFARFTAGFSRVRAAHEEQEGGGMSSAPLLLLRPPSIGQRLGPTTFPHLPLDGGSESNHAAEAIRRIVPMSPRYLPVRSRALAAGRCA